MFERTSPERHDSLPDIPEPSENPLLAGHGDEAGRLAQAFRAGKLPHALLFAGAPGIGKATLAFHLANHLLAYPDRREAPETLAAPDPASRTFRLIAQDAHPALLHLTRPYSERDKKFRTVVTVDEIRRIARFLSMTVHDGGHRVVIVDPADDMNVAAANALLKSLEEPPPRTIFVLVSHSPGRLLPTIRSRCQTVRLRRLADDTLLDLLERLGAELPDTGEGRAGLAARAAGSARDAILMTAYGGLEIASTVEQVAKGERFDVAAAHQLGDAVGGRDRAVHFSIFNRLVLDIVSARAAGAAEAGQTRVAARMAELWDEIGAATRETETYNLDRKQHVLGTLGRLHAALGEEGQA